MLSKLLSRFTVVHRAKTPEEREAIYRFRYDVYITELNKKSCGVIDHKKKWIRSEDDESPFTTLFYTGTLKKITGTIRIDIWPSENIPKDRKKRYQLNSIDLKKQSVGEVSKLIVHKNHRGFLILNALSRKAYQHLTRLQNRFLFLYCAPGLIPLYQKLGARTLKNQLLCHEDGIRIPMVIVLSDVSYFKKMKSPLLDLAQKTYQKTLETDLDLICKHVDVNAHLKNDQKQAWKTLKKILKDPKSSSFIHALEQKTLKFICNDSFILDVSKNIQLIREALVEEEMFIILKGGFIVLKDQKQIDILRPGDIFGEQAFFRNDKKRSASVCTIENSKVLVLKRSLLRKMKRKNLELANNFLHALTSTLCQRLS